MFEDSYHIMVGGANHPKRPRNEHLCPAYSIGASERRRLQVIHVQPGYQPASPPPSLCCGRDGTEEPLSQAAGRK
ncbi:hypothetical protein FQA47_017531 [Oryzias melastigma]|uniref:Uncharacterized protein n=1 Tax=Oryzias melastigma TaxID=30732 RepID=A0A834KZV3_ORYME|nr:hypothetical protein FQA47_017531 [Oryzias melastigma]